MEFHISFQINNKLFNKDPESSVKGREIIKSSIDLIYQLGFENFTFKKLAKDIKTTEATVYRYFENKHKLLLYILNWYWCYFEYLVMFNIKNVNPSKEKLEIILKLLTEELPDSNNTFEYNKKFLTKIILSESSKVYLIKNISEINQENLFKPYKDLCSTISSIILEFNPNYKYSKSLSSTLVETAHNHEYFLNNLPRLTDINPTNKENLTYHFLHQLLFKSIS